MSIKNQVAVNVNEIFKAGLTFEREAHSQGEVVKGYHTDNGIFNSSEFMEDLLRSSKR